MVSFHTPSPQLCVTESLLQAGVANKINTLSPPSNQCGLQFHQGRSGFPCLSFTTFPTSSLLQKFYSRQAESRWLGCTSLTQLPLMQQGLFCLRCNMLMIPGLDHFSLCVWLTGQREANQEDLGLPSFPTSAHLQSRGITLEEVGKWPVRSDKKMVTLWSASSQDKLIKGNAPFFSSSGACSGLGKSIVQGLVSKKSLNDILWRQRRG